MVSGAAATSFALWVWVAYLREPTSVGPPPGGDLAAASGVGL